MARRDRIVVSTLRCGRSNLGSNPSHGILVRRPWPLPPFTSPGNLHDCNPTEYSSQRPHPWSEQKETEGGGFSFCAAVIQGAQQGASCAVIGGTPSFFVIQDGQEKDPIKSVSDKRLLLPSLVLPVSSGLLGISAPRTFSILGHCSLPSHRTDLSSALRCTPSRI